MNLTLERKKMTNFTKDFNEIEWFILKQDLERQGFKGECSFVKNFMKTASNKFNASCTIHDICYTIGNTEEDRRKADFGFYRRCVMNALHSKSPHIFLWYVSIATIWYFAVRCFGWLAFNYTIPVRSRRDVIRVRKLRRSLSTITKLKMVFSYMRKNLFV